MEKKKKKSAPAAPTNCEMCVYFDTDPETGEDYCSVNLDEDEMVSFMTGNNSRCPYFYLHDEYKTVRRQN
ncbi:MAG: hypothetical protein IJD67_05030 [Clostridia bacterium]|nr:hypothetical protein [Clostridia bacterium]